MGILVAVFVACSEETSPTPLQLLDLTGQVVNPLQAGSAKATVFLFTTVDCPISNRYAPEIQRLHEKFAPRGVDFYLVYADPDASSESIEKHIREYGYQCRVLRDPQHLLVRHTQATVTPEAAVFDDAAQMVYRGRIDDRYVDYGKARATPTSRDLEEVLEATLAGRREPLVTTPAVGCFIPDLQ